MKGVKWKRTIPKAEEREEGDKGGEGDKAGMKQKLPPKPRGISPMELDGMIFFLCSIQKAAKGSQTNPDYELNFIH
ncbi:unnamed protein product [Linum trigynum]|uniref:Uncharacterized protein n=1 Tax=Linum trigynum TaxID=586398 RepID=A0AAV2EW03_9ROSI